MIEIIETARDNLDTSKRQRELGIVDEEASSDSDSSDDGSDKGDDDGSDDGVNKMPDGSAEHKQGPLDQLRDYKKRDKALHRQHRGAMQWKVNFLGMAKKRNGKVLTKRTGSANGQVGEAQVGKGRGWRDGFV